mgnify:CR=1 FL=1
MNINKAIKIKEDMLYKRYLHHPSKVEEADKLGIEAMKREKERRFAISIFRVVLLLGETEE